MKMVKNNKDLMSEIEELNAIISSLKTENTNLKTQVESLQFTLKSMNKQIFGSKSEKSKKHVEEERNLFNLNEAEQISNVNALEPTIDKVVKRKSRTSRSENIKSLREEKIAYELQSEEQVCNECGSELKAIGTDSRETIKIMKEAIKVLEETTTYACIKCDYITRSEMPKLAIPGGIASSSLLSQVIVDKVANALPLYRQSEDYARIGLNLSRQNLANWMIKSANLLEVIFNKMKTDLLSTDIIHADETTLQVLKESGKPATSKSYMWTYVSNRYDNDIVLYEYQDNRSGKNAKEFLSTFKGYLNVDGYAGYNSVENVELVNCFAHLRRKFIDLFDTLTDEEKANSKTKIAVDYITEIYRLDNESKELDISNRLEFKQNNIKPIMIEFNKWLNENILTAASESPYGKAMAYAVKYLPSVMKYLEDGRLDIDNNRAERAVKPFVIGRKNWLFSNTANGARSSAILYSIVQTAIMNKINPYKYLEHILDILANQNINEIDFENIMPYSQSIKTEYKM